MRNIDKCISYNYFLFSFNPLCLIMHCFDFIIIAVFLISVWRFLRYLLKLFNFKVDICYLIKSSNQEKEKEKISVLIAYDLKMVKINYFQINVIISFQNLNFKRIQISKIKIKMQLCKWFESISHCIKDAF